MMTNAPMSTALYGGVNAAVLTPMLADLSVDLDRMAAHCRWLLANGCNGLAILGTTGEANSLGISERIAVIEGLVSRGIPAAKLLPGTGTTAITDTVLLTKQAAELGCRGALLLPPFYYKGPSDDGLFAYFSEVINRVGGGIKIYVYNFPQQSAVPFSLDLIGRLLKAFPKALQGIKDSSGDLANTSGYAKHYAAEGFEVYAGDDSLLHTMLQIGGAGCITAAGNLNSAIAAQVYANWNNAIGERAQVTLTATRKAVTSVPLISGLKALKARHTGDAVWSNIRPPHLKLTAEQQQKLFAAWDACGVELAHAA
jgi:4-hydroxy-tetrahydrodipicolinate synthase